MTIPARIHAPLLCTAIRLQCSDDFAASHILRKAAKHHTHDRTRRFQHFSAEQTAYHGLHLLTGVRYDENAWEIIDSTVVMGDAAVGRVDDNVALLVLFGSLHCALIVEHAFVQSCYVNNAGFPARAVPHATDIALCDLAGMPALATVDTELIYIKLDPVRVAVYHQRPLLPNIEALRLTDDDKPNADCLTYPRLRRL